MSFSRYEKHLVECPHCHKDVLDHMTECPFCKGELTPVGYYSSAPQTPEQRRMAKIVRIVFWVIAGIVVLIMLLKRGAAA